MRLLRLSLLSVALSSLLVAGSVSRVDAKTSRKVSHSYEKVWPAAVRFLRIDEGLVILEKDVDNGYLLFELDDEGKRFSGSVEVIRRKDTSDRDAVELILTIKDRPSYMESGILNRMLLKIRKELGLPKRPPPKSAPKEDDDRGKDQEEAPKAPAKEPIE